MDINENFGNRTGLNEPAHQTYKFGNIPQPRSPSPPVAESSRYTLIQLVLYI